MLPGACCGLTKSRSCAILFIETGAAGQTVVSRSVTEVTAQWVRQGGYFFLMPLVPVHLNDLEDEAPAFPVMGKAGAFALGETVLQ